MIRVTIQDSDQAISFLAESATVLRLIAGCSINPKNLAELLIATDIYQRNLATTLMAGLMEFDKALHHHGSGFIHQEIARARQTEQPLEMPFQVIDDLTRDESRQMRASSLVIIDLPRKEIWASPDLDIPSTAEVNIQTGESESNRLVSYILPVEWKIETLK